MAESEAETPGTPGEFESKYFEFHGVRLPPFCRGKMEDIADFPVRPSDVWIVTYPKSGKSGTLLRSRRPLGCVTLRRSLNLSVPESFPYGAGSGGSGRSSSVGSVGDGTGLCCPCILVYELPLSPGGTWPRRSSATTQGRASRQRLREGRRLVQGHTAGLGSEPPSHPGLV